MDESLLDYLSKKLKQVRIVITPNKTGDTTKETTNAQAIIDAIIEQAVGGDKKSQEMILAYLEGTPRQRLDITSKDKEINAINISGLSTEELHKIIADAQSK